MDNKKKYLMIGVIVLAVVLLISGGTYAFITWSANETQATNVVFTVTPDYTCGADAGGHITSSDRMLAPTDCMDPEYAIQRTITTLSTTTGDKVISMDLWLNVNHVDTNLLNSPNFKYAITKNKNSCTSGIINSGVINEDIQDNKINLLEGVEYATLSDTYYLYIWLDEAETNHNTMNQSFDLSIDGQCRDNNLEKTKMVDFTEDDKTTYFREDDYRTKITEIHFVYDKDLPSGVVANQVSGKDPYQLSTNASKPIYGYLNKIGNTDTYKLYITSKYKIYAGELFATFWKMTALSNITFDNFDTSETTTMRNMFRENAFTSLDLSSFNTANVTTMRAMFSCLINLTSLDISTFNTSKVTNMMYMFQACTALSTLDVSSFDTSNVESMYGMFLTTLDYGVMSLQTIVGIEKFDTSKVTDMTYMFQYCSNLTNLDLSKWNVSRVSNMQGIFINNSSLVSIDMSGWDTSSVNNMRSMFNGCSGLTSLDLSSFNTSSVNDMRYMFSSCTSLRNIYVSELWSTNAVSLTNSGNMFNGDTQLPNYNSSKTDKTNAHYGEGGYLTYKAHN